MNYECMFEGCKRDKIMYPAGWARGVCGTHYKLLRTSVAAGKRTWEELEKAGLCEKANKTYKKRGT